MVGINWISNTNVFLTPRIISLSYNNDETRVVRSLSVYTDRIIKKHRGRLIKNIIGTYLKHLACHSYHIKYRTERGNLFDLAKDFW